MRRAQRTYKEPIKYEIGRDISQEQFDEAVIKIADWFAEWRNTKEPAADARRRLQCAMEGKTLDGKQWWSHGSSSLATRVRMLCRFDLDKMQPIRKRIEDDIARGKGSRLKRAETRIANDELVPEETRKELAKNLKFGDDPKILLTPKEHTAWKRYRVAYVTQFPELSGISAEGELNMLCDLHVVNDRNRLRLLQGIVVDERAMLDTTNQIVALKKALGIHPDQLAKRVDTEAEGSIAQAIKKLGSAQSARELREKFWLEELITIYSMYMRPSPDPMRGGYQLDEVGLHGMVKCRTCVCKCGRRNYVGIEIQEIEQYLIEKGVLEPLPAAPPIGSPGGEGDAESTSMDETTPGDSPGA